MASVTTSIKTREGRIIALALASRLAVLAFMICSDAAFPDLSSSAHLQNFPCDKDIDRSHETRDDIYAIKSTTAIDSLAPWDSVYFTRIAKCGYENDMINAFFPLLPLLMRYTEKLSGLFLLEPWIPVESLYTFIGFIINIIAFVVAAVALHCLSMHVVQDVDIANFSTIIFIFNPASVFYSAVYTESIFAACSWVGVLLLPSKYWLGVGALTAGSAARSNGILACWFIIHPLLQDIISRKKERIDAPLLLKSIAGCCCIFSPYIIMQILAYYTYCGSSSSPQGNGAVPPSWCFKLIPSVYGYVQAAYWDVGFLKFYEKFVRWPRVIQSLPVISFAIAACWTWAAVDWYRAFTLSLFQPTPSSNSSSSSSANTSTNSGGTATTSTTSTAKNTFFSDMRHSRSTATPNFSPVFSSSYSRMHAAFVSPAVAPYVYHLALMTAAVALVMHVNVATRFLSASPLLYWYMSLFLLSGGEWWRSAAVWLWILSYIVLGSLMFPNFYPWT